MKNQFTKILIPVIGIAVMIGLTAFAPDPLAVGRDYPIPDELDDELKEEAFAILATKCNTCHRKQNPFMIFNRKNMVKRASRIYKAVFVERRMPKGNKVRLNEAEYATLKNWLSSNSKN